MREILGDVLGDSFKGVSLKNYNKALKKVEDKEDYETGKQTLKDTEEDHQEGEEENEEDVAGFDQAIDMETVINALPKIIIYGLKMIKGYSGNFENFREEEEQEEQNEGREKQGEEADEANEDEDDEADAGNNSMKPPLPLERNTALNILKEEKIRFQKYYGY